MFQDRRNKLITQLQKKGIKDKRVLDAVSQIPREIFLNDNFKSNAYDDKALPIQCGQTISQPYTVAFMSELLDVQKGDKILEIGTGSGYQAILLYLMGAKVFTVERHDILFRTTSKLFKQYKLTINTRHGDGTLGWKEFAPFDKIIITAAAPKISEILLAQLKIGGKMVVPVGDMDSQVMYLIEKVGEKVYNKYKKGKFKFVPLIGKDAWEDNSEDNSQNNSKYSSKYSRSDNDEKSNNQYKI